MTEAEVVEVYNAWCADCCEGAGPFDYHKDAKVWVTAHNQENHS